MLVRWFDLAAALERARRWARELSATELRDASHPHADNHPAAATSICTPSHPNNPMSSDGQQRGRSWWRRPCIVMRALPQPPPLLDSLPSSSCATATATSQSAAAEVIRAPNVPAASASAVNFLSPKSLNFLHSTLESVTVTITVV